MRATIGLIDCVLNGAELDSKQAIRLAQWNDLPALMEGAAKIRDRRHGALVSYSKKVFIPLTKLCRDSCHYCTFAQPPRPADTAYLSPDEVLSIARAGVQAGCHEALFTLGDKLELRYRAARDALAKLGYSTTLDYLAAMASLVFKDTGLLPHLNSGVMNLDEIKRLRTVSGQYGHIQEVIIQNFRAKSGTRMAQAPEPSVADHLWTIAVARILLGYSGARQPQWWASRGRDRRRD